MYQAHTRRSDLLRTTSRNRDFIARLSQEKKPVSGTKRTQLTYGATLQKTHETIETIDFIGSNALRVVERAMGIEPVLLTRFSHLFDTPCIYML